MPINYTLSLLCFHFISCKGVSSAIFSFFRSLFQTNNRKNSCSQVSLFNSNKKKEKKWNEMRREKMKKTDNAVAYGYFIFIKLKIKVSHTHLWACVSGVVLCRVCVCELCVRELCSESGRVIYTCFSICIVRAIRLSTCTVCVIVYLHRILGAAFRINRGICNVHSPIHILHDTLS